MPLNDGFIILDGPGDDNVAADRFLIVCGVDTISKKNDGSRKSTDLGSELLNTEIEYLFRVDVGHSLDSTIQVPIAAFEEYCPGNGSGSGEHSMEEHVPTDILNIQEQWKLFSVSFPYEVSIEKIGAEIKTGSAYESKAGGGRGGGEGRGGGGEGRGGEGGGGGGEGRGGEEKGDQQKVYTALASVLVMSSRTAKQSSLVLIQQSGKVYVSVLCYVCRV